MMLQADIGPVRRYYAIFFYIASLLIILNLNGISARHDDYAAPTTVRHVTATYLRTRYSHDARRKFTSPHFHFSPPPARGFAFT